MVAVGMPVSLWFGPGHMRVVNSSGGARILEVGCGTGAVTRVLAAWPGVVEAVGVDPSPVFVAKARELIFWAHCLHELGGPQAF